MPPSLVSCRNRRRLGEEILHRVPEQVSIVAEIGGVRRLRQDYELAIAIRELTEEVEQVVVMLVAFPPGGADDATALQDPMQKAGAGMLRRMAASAAVSTRAAPDRVRRIGVAHEHRRTDPEERPAMPSRRRSCNSRSPDVYRDGGVWKIKRS